MNTFDESKIKRDGSGQFAEKPAAPESDLVLADVEGAEPLYEYGDEPPVQEHPRSSHEVSEESYAVAEREMAAVLARLQEEKVRHRIAAAVEELDSREVGAQKIAVVRFDDPEELNDDGSTTSVLDKAYDADGDLVADLGEDGVQWTSVEGSGAAFDDFANDEGEIDMEKVRAWSRANPVPLRTSHVMARASDDIDARSRGVAMADAASKVRTSIPDARYLLVAEADEDDMMTFTGVADESGATLYEAGSHPSENRHLNLPRRFESDVDDMVRGAGGTGVGWGHAVGGDARPDRSTGFHTEAVLDIDKLVGPATGRRTA